MVSVVMALISQVMALISPVMALISPVTALISQVMTLISIIISRVSELTTYKLLGSLSRAWGGWGGHFFGIIWEGFSLLFVVLCFL